MKEIVVVFCLLVFGMGMCYGGQAPNRSIDSVFIFAGTAYQFGWELGNHFRPLVDSFLKQYSYLNQLEKWKDTPNGKLAYDSMLQSTNISFPTVIDELRGYSDGVGLPFEYCALMMMKPEISLLLKQQDPSRDVLEEACSDVSISSPQNGVILAHNEDFSPLFQEYSMLVTARLLYTDSGGFTAFAYPLQLPGNAFGFTTGKRASLIFSTNAVFPKNIETSLVPRYAVSRNLLDTVSLDDAISLVKKTGCASGFSLNICDNEKICNVEVGGALNVVDCLDLKDGHGYLLHFNMYLRLNVSQWDDASSIHRLQTATNIISQNGDPLSGWAAAEILGDHSDPQYPIYRDARPPDTDVTIATCIYNSNLMEVFLFNPKNYFQTPSLSFKV